MSRDERIRRAQHAEHLRNDELLSEAWKQVEDHFVAQIIASSVSEREKRDDAIRCLQLLTKLQEFLIGCVRDGKVDQRLMDEESKLQRMWNRL